MAEAKTANARISELVSRALSVAGINQSNLKLARSWAYLIEYLNKELFDICMLVSGSVVETSQIAGSDVDQMVILPNVHAVQDPNQVMDIKSHICIMETKDSRYGFSKLQNTKIQDVSGKDNMAEWVRNIIEESTVEEGDSYMSSSKFIASFLKLMSDTNKYSSFGLSTSSIFRHGPCTTIEIEHSSQSDVAVGIECITWPLEAEEWCTRSRYKRWPSDEMLSNLKKMPCCLLPVGDEQSKDCSMEWRFAYVQTERELIWGFNDTQIQCYVILKLLKKDFLEPIAPDQLSSFFLKTIVFWETEKVGIDPWKSENLFHCVHLCIDHLKSSVQARDLPHYIFRKRNLLYTKFRDQKMQTAVVNKLQELQTNITPYILQIGAKYVPLHALYTIWTRCNRSLPDLILEASTLFPGNPELHHQINEKVRLIKTNDVFLFIVHLPTTTEKLFRAAEYMKTNEDKFDKMLRKTALSCLALELGKLIIPEILKPETFTTKEDLIQTAFDILTEGAKGSASGLLYRATLHYILGEHIEAMAIISTFEKTKETVFYVGNSAAKKTFKGQGHEAIEEISLLTEDTIAYDIVFTSGDVSWAPKAIRMECALLGDHNNWNFCVFHPLVYAYYLFCQICIDRKNAKGYNYSIKELSNFLCMDSGGVDRHRAYNLLGFCNFKAGYYQAAIGCFQKSLQIMDSNGNAAAFHLCILLMEMMNRQKNQCIEEIIYERIAGKE